MRFDEAIKIRSDNYVVKNLLGLLACQILVGLVSEKLLDITADLVHAKLSLVALNLLYLAEACGVANIVSDDDTWIETLEINDHYWVSVKFFVWLYHKGYDFKLILIFYLLRTSAQQKVFHRFANFGKNSFNPKLTASGHDTFIINPIHFGHVHIPADQVKLVHDVKHGVNPREYVIYCLTEEVLTLSPPLLKNLS